MAKKKRRKASTTKSKSRKGRAAGTKRSKKKKARKAPKTTKASRQALGIRRAKLHQAAAMLKDFHGGKGPLKSGCGRPRKKR